MPHAHRGRPTCARWSRARRRRSRRLRRRRRRRRCEAEARRGAATPRRHRRRASSRLNGARRTGARGGERACEPLAALASAAPAARRRRLHRLRHPALRRRWPRRRRRRRASAPPHSTGRRRRALSYVADRQLPRRGARQRAGRMDPRRQPLPGAPGRHRRPELRAAAVAPHDAAKASSARRAWRRERYDEDTKVVVPRPAPPHDPLRARRGAAGRTASAASAGRRAGHGEPVRAAHLAVHDAAASG